MTNALFDYITSSALSLTMAGNTGISPFLTLLILGVVEMGNPELLNMGETMEVLLASWWSIGILGLLTIGEIVGKCIPAIDEMIDSAEVFVVPVISILASMATLGLLGGGGSHQPDIDAGQGQSIDVLGMFGGGDGDGDGDGDGYVYGEGYRSLQETAEIENIDVVIVVEDDSDNDFGEGFITFTKICLVVVGIGLSLLIHFFKMLVRVSSLICSAGCCQPCITIMEFLLVVCGVMFAILVPAFAVVACIALLVAAGYVIRVKFCKNKNDDNGDNKQNNNNNNNNGVVEKKGTRNSKNDEENPERTRAKRNSSTTPSTNDIAKWVHITSTAPSEALSVDEFVTVPLTPPVTSKPDVEATTY